MWTRGDARNKGFNSTAELYQSPTDRARSTSLARFRRRMVSARIRAGRQASGIDAGHRRAEPALATEKLVGETDHSRIGPRLRSDPQESIDDGVLALVRKRLRQYHRHGRGGAGDARVAMDQEMAKIRAYITAERQDRLDVRPVRQDDPGAGLDLIVKIQRRAQVGIESAERRWFRPLRIENG